MCRMSAITAVLLIAGSIDAAEPQPLWWSLQPLIKPKFPEITGAVANRVRNPIDAFVLAKLKEKGMTPAPEADPRTLIRRLYFDLIGLPPTIEETDRFLKEADARPQAAYEALVDRLLASPRYGERWARHWMDVVHFAETHGNDQDRVRPNAWPYRDYLVDAFNSDRPYSRFVQEQIAGDILFPDSPERVPALGMLSAGPWDESSLRDIREDSIDRQVGYYLDRDDMVATVIGTFNSLTVHCARCHDHKFDPIKQEDYYALQAVFAGVGRADRTFDLDPLIFQKRRELGAKLAALAKRDPKILVELLTPALKSEIKAWEAEKPRPIVWTVLDPTTFTSANGSTLTKLADKSILASGKKPDRDVYTISSTADLKGITAFRLELLPDDSLPKQGPGRCDNGNLHLNEFRVKAAPKTKSPEPDVKRGKSPEPDAKRGDLAITDATADFNQTGWTIRHAIDNIPGTAWGIYPEVGKAHQAIFELKKDAGFDGGTQFTFVLEQQHGGGHLIGRLRLSATSSPRPLKITQLPDAIANALAVPRVARNLKQKEEIAVYFLIEKLSAELAKLPPAKMVYAIGHDFAPDGSHKPPKTPRPVFMLKRGDINKPLGEVKPGTLSCLADMPSRFKLDNPDDEAARRAALAKWITDPKNPLTWRSIVNRVWHYHFGKGIVDSPNDFGKMGGLPSHPELLDYLAMTFRDGDSPSPTRSEGASGGSLKHLHKLIVMSSTYRQSSLHNPANAKLDADNRYLWRMNRNRLDAESARDSVLLVSGRLNLKMGGPSDQQFSMKPGIHVTPIVNYLPFNWDRPEGEGHRRSIYRFIFRTLPDPFVACLDGADASQLTPARNNSITPLQALALLNNEFILVHSKALAASLEKATGDKEKQIAMAIEKIWGRPPTKDEREEMKAYVAKHGLANLCRLLFNSNEFLFVN